MTEIAKRADRLATDRWNNEGGRVAPESVLERELRAADHRRRARARPHVLIAGEAADVMAQEDKALHQLEGSAS